MRVFMYCAALYCEDCGNAIRADLDKRGKRPAEIEDESSYDSDEYPKGPYSEGGGEADTPQHCDSCHCFLDNALTGDGVAYVREAIEDSDGDPETLLTWLDEYGAAYDIAEPAGAWLLTETRGHAHKSLVFVSALDGTSPQGTPLFDYVGEPAKAKRFEWREAMRLAGAVGGLKYCRPVPGSRYGVTL